MSPCRSLYTTAILSLASLGTAAAVRQDAGHANFASSLSGRSAQQFDYVVVGGGLSGLVVASRLSENAEASVLVLEFGAVDRSNTTLWPVNALTLNTADLFNITSAPEPGLAGNAYTVLAGAVAGGGSTVNGMYYDRASAGDYDSWELLGNPGWGWHGLFPYFKKSADFTPPDPAIEAQYNYTWNETAYTYDGPLQVSFPDFQYPDNYPFFDAFTEQDIPFIQEHALGQAVGVFWAPTTEDPKKKTRSTSLNAYYDKASSRENLKLLTEYQVTEVLFDSDLTAQGVKATDRTTGAEYEFVANKEVILAAGGVHTPQILQLSGIGPKDVLDAAGVSVKLDFPAVGSNFQDHPVAYLNWNVTNSFPYPGILDDNATFNAEALSLYLYNLTGPYTRAQGNSAGFLSLEQLTTNASCLLDALLAQNASEYLPPVYASSEGLLQGFLAQRQIIADKIGSGAVAVLELPFEGSGAVPNALEKPLSRGTVHLNASNPHGEPVVTFYALTNPFDKEQLGAAVNFTRRIFASDALAYLDPVETIPGTQYQTVDEIYEQILVSESPYGGSALGPSFAHPSCSCPMMPEHLGGVVSSDLLVYGTSKLSIVDCSILPVIPAAHLQATMYAVAEKAADIIKARA